MWVLLKRPTRSPLCPTSAYLLRVDTPAAPRRRTGAGLAASPCWRNLPAAGVATSSGRQRRRLTRGARGQRLGGATDTLGAAAGGSSPTRSGVDSASPLLGPRA